MSKALLFDCDGVLGDTEEHGHLPAFNRMWRESGINWQWSVEEYGRKLAIGGGKERMASLFEDKAFLAVFPHPGSAEAVTQIVAAWHKRKSAIYEELIMSGKVPPRPGVSRLAGEAVAAGWLLGVCSTSKRESVLAVLRHSMGEALAGRFSLVIAGDEVKAKKPAPDIYLAAAERLGVAAADCVVVEDSRNGLVAADRAGMRCLVTVSGYTRDEGFAEAALVVSSLGNPGGERCEVLANAAGATVGAFVTVANLDELLRWKR
jgi:HAD superfamily hydrolase (TIGR01509 family)